MAWYAVRSKTHKEEALWREIGARGHEVFYPRLRVRPVNPRARKVKPYFPGYLFVRLDHPAAFAWMPYAQGLVSFGGEPAAVPDEIISAIKGRVDERNARGVDGFDNRGVPVIGLKPGDPVVINDGPFGGYKGIFDAQLAGSDRVRVLLQLLQSRPLMLALPAAQIQPTNRL